MACGVNGTDGEGVVVLGDGGWGTALALVLVESGCDVTLWGPFPEYVAEMDRTRHNPKFLPGVSLPDRIRFSADPAVVGKAEILFSVVPSRFLRSVARRIAPFFDAGTPVVSATKGIEEETLLSGTGVLRDVLGPFRAAVVSGPSHAEEVARRMPTTVVAASEDEALALHVQTLLNTERFRVYTLHDVIGVELCGALKNVVSIAAGIVDGRGWGDNTKSALLARGLAEMSRLGTAMGARRETFYGLAGVGDLVTSCFSKHGRNRYVGERLGRGETLDEILSSMEMVAEGVTTAKGVYDLMNRFGVDMPICREVYRVLYQGKSPDDAIRELMTRKPRPETER